MYLLIVSAFCILQVQRENTIFKRTLNLNVSWWVQNLSTSPSKLVALLALGESWKAKRTNHSRERASSSMISGAVSSSLGRVHCACSYIRTFKITFIGRFEN